MLDVLFHIFFSLYTVADFLKTINQDYSNLLTAIFSCLLFVVTTVYVICTYSQVGISKKSIALNIDYLKQLESEHKTSVTPVLVPNEISTHGGGCYPFNDLLNRRMNVYCDLTNIGNSPAIQIYTKVGLKFKYVEGSDRSFSSEYYYAGSLAINNKYTATTFFDMDKLSLLFENLSIMCKHNTNLFKNDIGQKLGECASLVIECVYSNIHSQYFKTFYERDIWGITAIDTEKKKRSIFKLHVPMLKDNEEFEVSYSNLMGFQSQEKYNCFSIHPYSYLGEKNGS